MNTIQRVGVIGAGTMGNGIAQACAVAGHRRRHDRRRRRPPSLRGLATIAGSLDRLVKKDKLTAADKDAALAPHQGHAPTTPTSTACDLVIEAATENLELKLKILREVDGSRSRTRSSRRTRRRSRSPRSPRSRRGPTRFLGMHFFNPVPMMALVELIRGLQTSDATVEAGGGVRASARQDADRREEQPRLRRQPHPVPDAQRGDLRAAGRAGDAPRTSTTA